MSISVIKRNGDREPLDIEKIHKVIEWSCEGLNGVSVSEIELQSKIQFYNNIKTKDIHETMIKSAADLISEDTPNYQYVAGRLVNYQLRKEIFGGFEPINLYEHYLKIMDIGYYDKILDQEYSRTDWDILDAYIKHDRDDNLTYAAMEQLRGKYLVKNRVTNEIYETPQISFMLIAMTLFHKYKEDRLKWVKDLYDALSTFSISLPTPIMAGVRTPQRQFSSCVLIESDDSLDSINATASSIVKYVSQRAGIGVGAGRIRAYGSSVRNGDTSHTGVIPYYRHFHTATASCSQGGIRDGKATLYYVCWHKEIRDLLVLKNNKGTEDNRIRHLDYGVQFNRLMYERLIEGKDITLFCPNDVPEVYDAFFKDNDTFKELYEAAEKNPKIKKDKISALELFSTFMQERKDTGRIYLMNVDHANDHSSFVKDKATIKMSNLCVEVTLPTKPLEHIYDENGEIAVCILGAINWGQIKKPEDFEKPCTLVVRSLNELIDMQHYPVPAAKNSTLGRRPIGVGVINFAYWLAKNGSNYSDPNLELIHEYAEAWSYYLIKASLELAEERGSIPKADECQYYYGTLPIDTYKRDVDDLVKPEYKMDWDSLRDRLLGVGTYNSTTMALMPSESSSQVSNSTSAIDPPRALVSVKQSKHGALKQVVPEVFKLKNKYELLWDQPSPLGYLKIAAVFQKFVDQSISTNTSYNPKFYPDDEIPMSEMIQYLLTAYKWGIKTLYYCNTYDGAGEYEEVKEDSDCDGCVI